VHKLEEGMGFGVGSILAFSGATAFYAINEVFKLQLNHKVLINDTWCGEGVYAAQIASYKNVEIYVNAELCEVLK